MNRLASALAVSALAAGFSLQSHAVPILRLTAYSGTTADTPIVGSAIVADGDIPLDPSLIGGSTVFLDASSISGGVAFNDSLGGWILNVTTGLSKPLLGSAFQPSMDLNSVNVSSQSSGLLRIELTDTDFNLAGETASSAAIGGSTDGMVSYKTFIDASNTPFGEGALLNDVGSFGSGVFGFGSTRSLTAPAVYSLTAVVDILHSAPFQASSFNATLKVPEPSSVALLGAGLLALGFFAKRKRSAQ